MRRNLWLTMIALGLLQHSSHAQTQIGMQQYYYMGNSTPLNPTPIVSFQSNNGFYAESRYNYEDVNTLSFYLGNTFAKEGKFSYSVTAMGGAVIGNMNGGSLAANISMGYGDFYLYSQPQYTFSLQNSIDNYIFTWTDLTYSPLDWLSVGISVQQNKQHYSTSSYEKGIVAEFAYKNWTFPLYLFNPQTSSRYFVMGANFELNFKRKVSTRKQAIELKSSYSITNKIDKESLLFAKDTIEREPVVLARVRRVSVALKPTASGNIGEPTSQSGNTNIPPESNTASQSEIRSGTKSVIDNKPQQEPDTLDNGESNRHKAKRDSQSSGNLIKSGILKQSANITRNAQIIDLEDPTIIDQSKQLYAIVLSPFKDEQEAQFIKSRLLVVFGTQSIIFSDGLCFKIRIPGFTHHGEAELYAHKAIISGFKSTFYIMPYEIKSINTITKKPEIVYTISEESGK